MSKCKAYVKDSGKCKIKVPTRYNDYCEDGDCPKKSKKKLASEESK